MKPIIVLMDGDTVSEVWADESLTVQHFNIDDYRHLGAKGPAALQREMAKAGVNKLKQVIPDDLSH